LVGIDLASGSVDRLSSIVLAASDAAAFRHIVEEPIFAELEAYPHTSRFGRAYHPAIHGDDHDKSFAVTVEGRVALVCLCAPLEGKLGFYGMPLRPILRPDLENDSRLLAVRSAFQYLDRLGKAHNLEEVVVLGGSDGNISVYEEVARQFGGVVDRSPVAIVDLVAGPAAWRAALRKSSRSLVNWGRRNLSIGYVNQKTPDRIQFDRYRMFHAEVAGRVTRSDSSWDVMYNWIIQGGGELVLGTLGDTLVAGSMFVDGQEISTYASGVYDRAQFDKPLGHYLLWLGMERAQARGLKALELGAVPARGTVTDKEYQIGYFKRGFATHIKDLVVLRWKPGQYALSTRTKVAL
jgi:hypothetical protein